METTEKIALRKERSKVQKALDELISNEWFAGNVYKNFAMMTKPEERKYANVFLDIAADELDDHFKSLVDYACSHGYEAPLSYSEMKKYADADDIKLFEKAKSGQDISYYIEQGIKSEDRAIEQYEKYVNDDSIKHSEPDLMLILNNNYFDEIDHKETLQSTMTMIGAYRQWA